MLGALILILPAGGMNGSFPAPMKRVRGWEWKHTWLVWWFPGMVAIPLVVASLTVAQLAAVYRAAKLQSLASTALYGMVWDASAVLFGLGITRVGLALGFGIILGISSSLGAVLPFLTLHRGHVFTITGLLTLAGVGIIRVGVVAWARAAALLESAKQQRNEGSFAAGPAICVLSRLGSSFMSLALNRATPIYGAAEALGVPVVRE
jgi:L-rhamnose-H+ transport protein